MIVYKHYIGAGELWQTKWWRINKKLAVLMYNHIQIHVTNCLVSMTTQQTSDAVVVVEVKMEMVRTLNILERASISYKTEKVMYDTMLDWCVNVCVCVCVCVCMCVCVCVCVCECLCS